MKHIWSILIMLLFTAGTPSPKSLNISGLVYEKNEKSPLPGVNVLVKGSSIGTVTDMEGKFSIMVPNEASVLQFNLIGYENAEITVGIKRVLKVFLVETTNELDEVVVTGQKVRTEKKTLSMAVAENEHGRFYRAAPGVGIQPYEPTPNRHNTEEYAGIHENIFLEPAKHPLSTFSIDVDAASYSNMRRFIQQGQRPPKDAVRIEELVNYFTYDYQQPRGNDPFSLHTELSNAPWNEDHYLLHIGMQGKHIPTENLPASNLVFLIDVSGSMDAPNKLGLLKSAFQMLVNQLRDQDKVSIVVYAGAAGLVLPPTSGDRRQTIMSALEQLQAGGSTAGGAGITLAYKIAAEQFMPNGNNRVILATDGDFNIGASSNGEMERLIEQEREKGVFLTVLGFGMGNYKDSKMEILADKGNGNYAYIDNHLEARKVLVNEFGGTLFTIAKDVKLQIEFNPALVKAYRLIGYENRLLQDEEFNDDRKDAGDLGSGHTVTALYEIIPQYGKQGSPYIKSVDDLKYQNKKVVPEAYQSDEMMTLKLRYKQPQGSVSKLIEHTVKRNLVSWEETSDNFRWSASVASFGMLLRDSEFKGNASYAKVEKWAQGARGKDTEGYRAEFIRLVRSGELLAQN